MEIRRLLFLSAAAQTIPFNDLGDIRCLGMVI